MKKFDEMIPIYLQVKQEIEEAILSKAIIAEEMVPSIRTLAIQYQINPQTVSNAFSELVEEGVLYKKRGIGFFVGEDAFEQLRGKKVKQYLESDLSEFVRKAKSLGISLEEIIKLIQTAYQTGGK